jgi:thioredoxin reductase
MSDERDYDVIIVGGGPAGLSAALVLGRCRRSVLVIDAGHPRNFASRAAHNFLTRDGIPPHQLLRLGREEIAAYGVEFRQGVVADARCLSPGFRVEMLSGESATSRKILLATGVTDTIPDIPNAEPFYGLGLHHCPYCDAYEYADQPIGTVGTPRKALGLAANLLTWSPAIVACSHGEPFTPSQRRSAARLGIALREERIARLEAEVEPGVFAAPAQRTTLDTDRPPHRLARIVFESGEPLPVAALFFNAPQVQRSNLPFALGCRRDEKGGVQRDNRQRTGVEGVYLAGDASRDVQFLVVAAAEGARAAVAINADFQKEARERRRD